MTDRKSDPNYKVISGYVPAYLAQRVRQVAKERGITLHQFLEEASIMWLGGGIHPTPGTIFELVARNLHKLKESEITQTHLNAIASRMPLAYRKRRSLAYTHRFSQNNQHTQAE